MRIVQVKTHKLYIIKKRSIDRLIPSTTTFCRHGSKSRSVSVVLPWTGSWLVPVLYLTSRMECVWRGSARPKQKIVQFGVPHEVCPGPPTVHTQPAWSTSSRDMVFTLICMPMTR